MTKSSAVLEKACNLLKGRLEEVDDERKRLERAARELGGKTARRAPGRPRGAASTKPSTRRRRARAPRADQIVDAIAKEPGIGTSGISKATGIKSNYLYQLLGKLQKEGRVKKRGRQYFPAG